MKNTRFQFLCVGAFAVFVLFYASAVCAQIAPPPHKSPRAPVSQQSLPDSQPAVPPTHEITGQAQIIDGERLHVGDLDLRLFGVVPPQLSASFGPQARTVLDNLTAGQTVSCHIRDRDHDGRFLATCHNGSNVDLALELLRRGLAVAARGSLQPTDLAMPYEAAEQAAQAQKLGLWSATIPPAASIPVQAAATKNETTPQPAATVVQLAPKPETKTEAATNSEPPAATKSTALADQVQATLQADTLAANEPENVSDTTLPESEEPGFLIRYQLLVTGLVMLVTALSILAVITWQRQRERRDEIRAIAAALRGELMAARAVCLTRAKELTPDADDKTVTWPRIRATVYQAYVGRLGWLGAELARKVASIYGQASDYASYYSINGSVEARVEPTTKRQALLTLIQHIDDVLPRLGTIEYSGSVDAVPLVAAPSLRAVPQAEKPQRPQGIPARDEKSKTQSTKASASAVPPPAQLWNTIRKLAQGLGKRENTAEAHLPDYESLLDDDVTSAYAESDDSSHKSEIKKASGQ